MFDTVSLDYFNTKQRAFLNEELRIAIIEYPFLTDPTLYKPTLFQVFRIKNTDPWQISLSLTKSFKNVEHAIRFCKKTYTLYNVEIQLEDLSIVSLEQSLKKNLQSARILVDGVYFGSLYYKAGKLLVSDENLISQLVLKFIG